MTWIETWLGAEQAREVIAESLFVFDVGLLVFIAAHLRREFCLRGFRAARARLGNQAALAVGVHTVGLMIIRGWTTLQFYLKGIGYNPVSVEEAYPVALTGLVIAVLGMACCIRIFSPRRWGNFGWILVFSAAIGFVGWMQATR
jgi:hypothetical protein